jgi:hypothetical protein
LAEKKLSSKGQRKIPEDRTLRDSDTQNRKQFVVFKEIKDAHKI